jgi:hypothetical protein
MATAGQVIGFDEGIKSMSLLNRIAYSNGDPQRALLALRLLNQRLTDALAQCLAESSPPQSCPSLAGRLNPVGRERDEVLRGCQARS